MGMAARNERRKLDAAFWNNLGIGVVLAGVAIPYISVAASGDAWVGKVVGWSFTKDEAFQATKVGAGMVIAIFLGWRMKVLAADIASRIEGD